MGKILHLLFIGADAVKQLALGAFYTLGATTSPPPTPPLPPWWYIFGGWF